EKVAEQLAIAIQQSELHHRLQAANKELARLSTTDALTQIANRRSFDSTLTQEWQRAQREQQELTLIFCDIDRFKHYNDTFGHPAGDACIATVAQALQQCVNRPNDCLARYGGEEFAIILPHTDLRGAVVIIEQMRAAIAERNIAYPTSQGHSRLTLSFGISTIVPQPHLTSQNLVYWADQALYQAKQSGRNGYAIVTGD
ncbi:MAG: diguanylate cyclase, partial [Cyanobacteria bacterium P01_C01_bin.70]